MTNIHHSEEEAVTLDVWVNHLSIISTIDEIIIERIHHLKFFAPYHLTGSTVLSKLSNLLDLCVVNLQGVTHVKRYGLAKPPCLPIFFIEVLVFRIVLHILVVVLEHFLRIANRL